ncbi:hypothetical protein A2U01_0100665, partial [Trifolium medium]|nr:hypothetical protein [Trifolium medium]
MESLKTLGSEIWEKWCSGAPCCHGAAASRPESVLATDLRRLATGLRRLASTVHR